MKNMKSTKRALLVSVMSLFVCFTMLIGTTYAWFTDSVTSAGNIIKTGTLEVSLEYSKTALTDAEDANWIDASTGPIFYHDNWEPGYVQVRYVKIENEGTLDLGFNLTVVGNENPGKVNLADVIEVYMVAGAQTVARADLVTTSPAYKGTLASLMADNDGAAHGDLTDGEYEIYTIALKMSESAGNEYQNQSVGKGFSVNLLAYQLTSEVDDLGDNKYDENAERPHAGADMDYIVEGQSAYELWAMNGNTVDGTDNGKLGTAVIPAGAVDPAATKVELSIVETTLNPNVTIAAGYEGITYEVTVTGLKENNDVPVKAQLYVGEGYDPNTVKVYHYADEVANTVYDPTDGYVTFDTTSFSPFTVVYDAESEYEAPSVDGVELPVANVVKSTEYENKDLPWGSYGQWSPTEDLDSQLEAAYTFTCVDNLETAQKSPYANWHCDFYVMLDRDLGANQIFLGGNYGSFGWVGFHNGDMTLAANTELPLLGSVTNNPWTYLDVVQNVGTFICGVGDVDDALADATFTVMLRLTNPEDESEYYDVATITHTFTKTVYSVEEFMEAINNGYKNIVLGNDMDLNQGITIPAN